MLGVPSFPAAASPQRQGSRKKIALKPGRSLMDWVRFANGPKDIQGFRGKIISVSHDELAKHNRVDDCWIAIKGKVYNVTTYLEYHPGGIDELMKAAGKDGTKLFDEVHKWVNFDSMLSKCYIGPLKAPSISIGNSGGNGRSKGIKTDGFLMPTGPIPTKSLEVMPRFDWYEKEGKIFISVYTKTKLVLSSDIIVDCENGRIFDLKILFKPKFYQIHLEFPELIQKVTLLKVSRNKIDIELLKYDQSKSWKTLGKGLDGHNQLHLEKHRELKFRDCTVLSVTNVTHDTKLFVFELPSNVYYETPIGHHVLIKANIGGMEIRRNYTVISRSLEEKVVDKDYEGKRIHLMIKQYEKGTITPLIHQLAEGSTISISDCIGTFDKKILDSVSTIYLIAAGTGFTPMIRLINYLIRKSDSECKVKLLFANKTVDDILWKEQIDQLTETFPLRFSVSYIISKPTPSWCGLRGRINESILKQFMSENFSSLKGDCREVPVIYNESLELSNKFYAICGPDEFTKSIENAMLNMNIKKDTIHCFLG